MNSCIILTSSRVPFGRIVQFVDTLIEIVSEYRSRLVSLNLRATTARRSEDNIACIAGESAMLEKGDLRRSVPVVIAMF